MGSLPPMPWQLFGNILNLRVLIDLQLPSTLAQQVLDCAEVVLVDRCVIAELGPVIAFSVECFEITRTLGGHGAKMDCIYLANERKFSRDCYQAVREM